MSVPGTVVLGVLLLSVLVVGCVGTSPDEAPGSAEALPTGLVGPVAPTTGPGALRFVVLGDSYAYGVGVPQADRWSNQLARILRPDVDIEIAANLSGRSTASADVIQEQLPQLVQLDPQFVGLQVGVNDAIIETPPATYAANMGVILDTVLARVHRADRVVVLTTPDVTLTPNGPSLVKDPVATKARIQALNVLLRVAAAERGIAVVDVSPISDRVQEDPSLVASDGLDPSGKQYAGWADLVATTVRQLFAAAAASAEASEQPTVSANQRTSVSPTGVPAASVSP